MSLHSLRVFACLGPNIRNSWTQIPKCDFPSNTSDFLLRLVRRHQGFCWSSQSQWSYGAIFVLGNIYEICVTAQNVRLFNQSGVVLKSLVRCLSDQRFVLIYNITVKLSESLYMKTQKVWPIFGVSLVQFLPYKIMAKYLW